MSPELPDPSLVVVTDALLLTTPQSAASVVPEIVGVASLVATVAPPVVQIGPAYPVGGYYVAPRPIYYGPRVIAPPPRYVMPRAYYGPRYYHRGGYRHYR